MYLRRHCYDKSWRCPGWAGGGWRYPRVERCDGGSLDIFSGDRPRWRAVLRFSRCGKCDVRAIPLITRWLDPTWLKFWATRVPWRVRQWWECRQRRRERRTYDRATRD